MVARLRLCGATGAVDWHDARRSLLTLPRRGNIALRAYTSWYLIRVHDALIFSFLLARRSLLLLLMRAMLPVSHLKLVLVSQLAIRHQLPIRLGCLYLLQLLRVLLLLML